MIGLFFRMTKSFLVLEKSLVKKLGFVLKFLGSVFVSNKLSIEKYSLKWAFGYDLYSEI